MGRCDFKGRQAFDHLKQLAVTIGPRLTGSAGEHRAARYIEKHFRSLKLKTRLQRYPSFTFDLKKCRFQVRERNRWRTIDCQPVMLSKNTPERGVEGEIHFVESGEEEYLTPAMKGKIVVVCGRIDPELYPRILKHRPLALIMIETQVSDEPIRVNFLPQNRENFGNLPAGRIRHLDGLELVKKGLKRARFVLRTTERKSHSFNVIGERPGDDLPDEIVVVCGHYDSSMGISGASDNAGGTSLVMELARVFAARPSRRTLRFVAFSGEETGLNGSLHYSRDLYKRDAREKKKKTFNKRIHKTEMDKHRLCFNLDVHGAVLGQNKALFSGPDEVGSSVKLLAKETGTVVQVVKGPMSSDGTCLAALKMPAVQLARYGGTTSFLHSTLDDIRNLSPAALEKMGRFTERYLERYVANAAAFPFERDVPDDQMKKITRFFNKGLKTTSPGEKEEPKRR
jgi:aminopeptidase YwaD